MTKSNKFTTTDGCSNGRLGGVCRSGSLLTAAVQVHDSSRRNDSGSDGGLSGSPSGQFPGLKDSALREQSGLEQAGSHRESTVQQPLQRRSSVQRRLGQSVA